jgi:2-methylaconitate cis-trans-isomerase PrpF
LCVAGADHWRQRRAVLVIAHIAYAARSRRAGTFTAHFVPTPPPRLGDLLLCKEPVIELQSAGIRYPISLVSIGNPYVFIDAASLGVSIQRELFADDRQLHDTLAELRTAAACRLGLAQDDAFVKIAAVGQFHRGGLAVRALSAQSWQRTLAFTGAVCLGVARTLPGTIPYQLAGLARCRPGKLTIDAPETATAVTAQISGTAAEDRLLWTSVTRKRSGQTDAVRVARRSRARGDLPARHSPVGGLTISSFPKATAVDEHQ